jgi:CBS domain containing-hemolysin-like protein
MTLEGPWLIILISLLLSGFFSGMEIAFVTANRLQIELEVKQGQIFAKLVNWFVNQKARFIAAMLVGNNIALVVYGIYMAQVLEPPLVALWNHDVFVLLSQTVLSTILVLITAEFLPKSLFRINPNWLLNVLALPLLVIYGLLLIPALVVTWISEVILRLFFKVESVDQDTMFGQIDLYNFLLEKTSSMDENEQVETEIQIFQNAMEFSKVKARECMVPRNEIQGIEIESSIESLKELLIATGHSKIMVYRENIDHIIGYVHSSELFKRPETLKAILRPIAMIPETKTANDILEQLISQRRNIAVVLDEYGGTSGMLTIEDVIEELFGEIEDEHDKEDLVEELLGEDHYRFAARHDIDYVNEKYRLNIPESEEYDTLAGFILNHYTDLPKIKDRVVIPPFRFLVTKMSDHRIEEVELKVTKR